MSGICQNCRIELRAHYNKCMNRRPVVIVVLLLASLGLVGLLGWQAWQLQKSNDTVARSVLHDYATLAADEYGRRLTAALGYRGYFQIISRVGEPENAAAMRMTIEQDSQLAGAVELVDGIFVVTAEELSVDGLPMTPALREFLMRLHSDAEEFEGPYLSIPAQDDRPQIIYTRSADTVRTYGFSTSVAGVEQHLRDALEIEPLLPTSLGEGKVGNDRLYVAVTDAAGTLLMVANSPFDDVQPSRKIMGDDYQRVVEGYAIDVAVDPAVASTLLIGGLPSERLPFLGLVMVLAIALLLTAIWLFRREHAVMRMRTDFVSQVSHELRTPLTQIRMFAETLLLKRARSDEEQVRALRVIDRESRRLSHLVENILRFTSRASSVILNNKLQPITPVIYEVVDTTRMTNPDVSIEMRGDDDAKAVIDAHALRQVLLNLLDNAIKYGPKEQTIVISVGCNNDSVEVGIADEGPGIPRGDRDRVWDAFYRLARERQTAISGTGIGLAVVRELVEAMGGQCWIAASGAGTQVIVQLPGEAGNG